MKNVLAGLKAVLLITRLRISKMMGKVIHPLKDMPVPDFNNQYDSTML